MANVNKCPHCGHHANLHSGPKATACAPGTCHNDDDAFKYEDCTNPCLCPGWHPLLVDEPEQLALKVVPIKPGRIARPRPKGTTPSRGTGFVSAGEVEWPEDAA